MSKFSIVKEVDESVLRKNMYEQPLTTNGLIVMGNEGNTGDESYYPYIFANKDTINRLVDQCKVSVFENAKISGGLVGYYLGNKLFEDNTLKFGEVELR